ncbi:MAG: hypothetical protein ACM3NV_00395 [Syntrophothermus sp.]
MQAGGHPDELIPAALASLGVAADETEMMVMTAAHAMFWPPIVQLLELDPGELEPEPAPDLSSPPPTR